jgi:alkanesulfonate monooxygenase SsuD/methylene tetrahydromethanopterin reductase-like flavin-dependent oxidoreductase (luciferase family)
MRYGLLAPVFGDYADARVLADLASDAEQTGWDGFFLWDHLTTASSPLTPELGVEPIVDVWVALAAIALRTERVRLGPLVTPLPRRRPWQVAREAVSLDHLSDGRLILGLGAGFPGLLAEDFAAFGDSTDARERAAMLDEGLEVITGLWTGEPFRFAGEHYQLTGAQLLPRPVQTPRIPIWIGAFWPHHAPYRRAARWDGVFPALTNGPSPEHLRDAVAYLRTQRTSDGPFDILAAGVTPGDEPPQWADAGATWWIEYLGPFRGTLADARRRVRQGPRL